MFHVKPEQENKSLYNRLSHLGINLSAEQRDQIERYCALIRTWSARKNLVSRSDLDKLIERHLVPSIFLAWICREEDSERIADLGAGSGFVGIIIKILYPNKSIYLIESIRKKYLFLVESCELLHIDCKVVHGRVEKTAACISEPLDLIVCRAVAPLDILWKWSRPLLKENGVLYALKGGNMRPEIEKIEEQRLKVSAVKPNPEWISLSSALEGKFVICIKE
jgi:16S rRNA (guanine527-N7)-methyltransferase